MSRLKQSIRNWIIERDEAGANGYDDLVHDLDDYMIDTLMTWEINDNAKRRGVTLVTIGEDT